MSFLPNFRAEENEEAFHVLKELMKSKMKLLGDKSSSVELARSHFYFGTISIEASKVSVALETLKSGMNILDAVFKTEDSNEASINADVAAMLGSLGYAKLMIGEVNAAKGKFALING